MSVHHWLPVPGFEGSYLLASEAPRVERAVVFVHGFLGDATGTWIDFQGRAEEGWWWHPADLYFFQYDSFGSSIAASADRLLGLLDHLSAVPEEWFSVPARLLPPGVRETLGDLQLRRGVTRYEELVLAGHSLGGVVLRQAILRRARAYVQELEGRPEPSLPELEPAATREEGEELLRRLASLRIPEPPAVPPLLEAALRLFAPAISGARPAGLLGVALHLGGIGGLARAVLGYSPSYAELRPGAGVVGKIERETVELAGRFPRLAAFRADVLWGERDDVVIDQEYACDRFRGRMPGKDHQTVCKPGAGYGEPLRLVSGGELDAGS